MHEGNIEIIKEFLEKFIEMNIGIEMSFKFITASIEVGYFKDAYKGTDLAGSYFGFLASLSDFEGKKFFKILEIFVSILSKIVIYRQPPDFEAYKEIEKLSLNEDIDIINMIATILIYLHKICKDTTFYSINFNQIYSTAEELEELSVSKLKKSLPLHIDREIFDARIILIFIALSLWFGFYSLKMKISEN
ncbi:MAG: hypothetical protein ACP5QT_06475 [Brevinematia bacterium]